MQASINQIPKRLFTVREAARYLGRPVWGIREIIWSGELPVIRRGTRGKIYCDIRDLDRFVETNKSRELDVQGEGGAR